MEMITDLLQEKSWGTTIKLFQIMRQATAWAEMHAILRKQTTQNEGHYFYYPSRVS
jgi:hypothetical protein